MPKHLKEDKKYGEIISRQGVRLVYLEDRVKELENLLIKERADRIDELTSLKYSLAYLAEFNNNRQNTLRSMANVIEETLEQLTGGIIQNKKEKNFYIDQDT